LSLLLNHSPEYSGDKLSKLSIYYTIPYCFLFLILFIFLFIFLLAILHGFDLIYLYVIFLLNSGGVDKKV